MNDSFLRTRLHEFAKKMKILRSKKIEFERKEDMATGEFVHYLTCSFLMYSPERVWSCY